MGDFSTAKEAARYLDIAIPNWYEAINVEKLDLIDSHKCIIGQIFDNKIRLENPEADWDEFQKSLAPSLYDSIACRNAYKKDWIKEYEKDWIKEIEERMNRGKMITVSSNTETGGLKPSKNITDEKMEFGHAYKLVDNGECDIEIGTIAFPLFRLNDLLKPTSFYVVNGRLKGKTVCLETTKRWDCLGKIEEVILNVRKG